MYDRERRVLVRAEPRLRVEDVLDVGVRVPRPAHEGHAGDDRPLAVRTDDLLGADPVQDGHHRRLREAALERLAADSSPDAFVATIATSNGWQRRGIVGCHHLGLAVALAAHTEAVTIQCVRVLSAASQHGDVANTGQMTREEAPDDSRSDDADPLDRCLSDHLSAVTCQSTVRAWPDSPIAGTPASLTRPRFFVPAGLTASSSAGSSSSGTSRPSSSALIRIESSPLFFPRTIPRSAPTRSEAYGSIAGGIVKLRGDGARLPREEVGAGDGFPRCELCSRELLHEPGERAHLLELESGRNPVERLQGKGDLDEVGVSRPLPHPVHGPLHPRRPGLDRCDGSGRREPEVVVPVPVDRNLVTKPL